MKPINLSLMILMVFAVTATAGLAADLVPPYAGPWPGWHGPWSGFWWVCPLMMFFMFVFFAIVFFAVRGRRSHWGPPWRWTGDYSETKGNSGGDSALDILNKRYARGEIDAQEYSEIKAAIGSDETSPRQS